MVDVRANETVWYFRNGLYAPERFAVDKHGVYYVIGDVDWNAAHPDKQEYIEQRMEREGVYREWYPPPYEYP